MKAAANAPAHAGASPFAALKGAPQGLDNIFSALLAHTAAANPQGKFDAFASFRFADPNSAMLKPGAPTIQPVKKGEKSPDTADQADPMAALANAMLAAVAQQTGHANQNPSSTAGTNAGATPAGSAAAPVGQIAPPPPGSAAANAANNAQIQAQTVAAMPTSPAAPDAKPGAANAAAKPDAKADPKANPKAADANNRPAANADPKLAGLDDALTAMAPTAKIGNGDATPQNVASAASGKAAAQADGRKNADTLLAALTGRNAPPAQTVEAKATPIHFDSAPQTTKAAAPGDSKDRDGSSNTNGGQDNSATMQKPDAAAALSKSKNDAQAAPQSAQAFQAPQPSVGQAAAAPTQHAPADPSANASAVAGAQPVQPQSPTPPAVVVATQIHTQAQSDASSDLGALAFTIAAKSRDGEKHFDIRLDPPDLGRVDVRLSVDNAGRAQAHLSADKQQTLDLLQRDRTTLERSLKDAGLNLSNNGLNFSLKGQERQSDGGSPGWARSARAVMAVAGDGPTVSAPVSHYSGGANARLDIRI